MLWDTIKKYQTDIYDIRGIDIGYLEKNAIAEADENPKYLYNYVLYDLQV